MKSRKRVLVSVAGAVLAVAVILSCVFILSDKNSPDVKTQIPDENVQTFEKIPDEKIAVRADGESSYSFDVTNVNVLVSQKDAVIVKGMFLSKHAPLFKDKNSPYPVTPYTFKVSENCSDADIPSEITVNFRGGEVLIKDAVEAVPKTSADKAGLSDLTAEEKESKYISYEFGDSSYTPLPQTEYALVLLPVGDGTYNVICDGYGVFRADYNVSALSASGNDSVMYKNVLTDKSLDINKK